MPSVGQVSGKRGQALIIIMKFNNLSCKLIAKKGKQAEIEIENQKLLVPSEYLPEGLVDGSVFELYFLSSKEAKIKQETMAKLILEEILNGK